MRTILPALGIVVSTALCFGAASAQEVGQELTLTGCLAEETEDADVEYALEHIDHEDVDIQSIDLVPTEDVNLAPHVGHTVEVAGVVVAEDEGTESEAAGMAQEDDERRLSVTRLSHLAASCPAGGR